MKQVAGKVQPPAAVMSAVKRILVADDEHLIATGLAGTLRDLGHEVVGIASDGEVALLMAREHHPDLALVDIRMPKLNGIEAAMALFTGLGVPSIIVSAYSDEEHIKKIQSYGPSSGVYGYLIKPVSLEELRVAIGVALQRSAMDREQAERTVQLERTLTNRRVVEQAKWILVEKHKLTEPAAHERLQKVARDRRKPLIEVAQGVIQSGDLT